MDHLKLFRKIRPLEIVNIEDARIEDLESRLEFKRCNLLDLTETDLDEVKARQEIINWLLNNQSLLEQDFFRRNTMPKLAAEMEPRSTNPNNSKAFLVYCQLLQGRETAFWSVFEDYKKIEDSLYELPPRIKQLSAYLDREAEVMYQEEKEVADRMLNQLRKTVSIQGMLKFEILHEKVVFVGDLGCYGTWYYHPNMDPEANPSMGFFAKRMNKYKITKSILGKYYDFKFRVLKHDAQIKKASPSLIDDITVYLEEITQTDKGFSHLEGVEITIGYVLDFTGLVVSFVDWRFDRKSTGRDQVKNQPSFGLALVDRSAGKISKRINGLLGSRENKRLDALANQWFLDNCMGTRIKRTNCDRVFSSIGFADLWSQYEEDILALRTWQGKLLAIMEDLFLYRDLAKMVISVNLPFSFPEIIKGQLVHFKEFYPIRVKTDEDSFCKPFSELNVNGKIVNMTGKNGSGKSTIMLAALDNLILAQCGLPVFASDAKMSLKTTLLLSFLDRDSKESTFTAKFEKDISIMRALEKMSTNERRLAFIINDELGSATDPSEMFDLATEYFLFVHDMGTPTLNSTQIKDLGVWLESVESGRIGENYIIDDMYNVRPGLESGRPKEVAKRKGFYELLNSKKRETRSANWD